MERKVTDLTQEEIEDIYKIVELDKELLDSIPAELQYEKSPYGYIEIESTSSDGYILTLHNNGSATWDCKDDGSNRNSEFKKYPDIMKYLSSVGINPLGVKEWMTK